MVVDTSAIIAILEDEPEREHFNRLIARAPTCRISSAAYVETSSVMEALRGSSSVHDLLVYLSRSEIVTEPVTVEHSRIAVDAYRTYGKGRHPAGLNFGDVFSYAPAVATGELLLFKGDDFSQTDIDAAAPISR